MTRHRCLLSFAILATLVGALATPSSALAADDEPRGGVETGTHPDAELPESTGGAGSGSTPSGPGTLVIHESAPPIDPGAEIYPAPETEDKQSAKIRTQFGGMTGGERVTAGGGSGSKGGESSAGGDKVSTTSTVTTRNSRAGRPDAPKPITFQIVQYGTSGDQYITVRLDSARDLEKIATVTPVTSLDLAGQSSIFAYSIVFKQTPTSSPSEIARSIFLLTGGAFNSCLSNGNHFFCTFATAKNIRSAGSPLTVTPDSVLESRQVPLCSNTMKDGGYGMTAVISVADVDCEAAPGREPVRLEVSTIYSDLALGIPTARAGDGSIVYSATELAQGSYASMEVWAVAADGTYSLPFTVAVRNRFAPTPSAASLPDQTGAVRPLEAIRGVDTVIPAAQLFSDLDVDLHQAESGDHLTSIVTEQGAMGGAWLDGAGNLHYQSIDVIRGDYTDHITVRTTDAFGLPSPDLRLSIHISDIIPGCATGTDTTDATTPVRIHLTCWITPTDGWHQIDGLTYRITEQPHYGTVTDLDPVSGIATYTPDPAHPEPATITFTATNNGATRTATHTINVLPAP
ncbi:hypothetical protein C5B96_04795 [Subtercola sp. Z020]|uniref:hypothetical protein n=1 Tax=Subtercola sp. Z020 TaxID=2080582 RepID=UPI000CE867A3|nr:hypothetical protein [Subtercola sp. Z020]PPF86704.1 hypothetical protein C5B96_04795 [Subtercola sp. Z020]